MSGDFPFARDLIGSPSPPETERATEADLIEAMRRVIALRRRHAVAESELEAACGLLSGAIARAESADALRRALDQDADLLLVPVGLKSQAYERLLELDGRAPETLREYAWHLQIHGPDWDEEATALLAEADASGR